MLCRGYVKDCESGLCLGEHLVDSGLRFIEAYGLPGGVVPVEELLLELQEVGARLGTHTHTHAMRKQLTKCQ